MWRQRLMDLAACTGSGSSARLRTNFASCWFGPTSGNTRGTRRHLVRVTRPVTRGSITVPLMTRAALPRKRRRGAIDTLPSGALRVRVYAGSTPLTGRRHDLVEVIQPGPNAAREAEKARTTTRHRATGSTPIPARRYCAAFPASSAGRRRHDAAGTRSERGSRPRRQHLTAE
jgi:hypothetical protein